MRWLRVVFGWGACLALSWAPVQGQDPIPLPMLPGATGAEAGLPDGSGPDATAPGEAESVEREPIRTAQAPGPAGATAPPGAAPATPGAAPGAATTPPPTAPATATATPPAAPGMGDAASRLAQISGLTGFGAPEMFGDVSPLPFRILQIGLPPVPNPPPVPPPPGVPPTPNPGPRPGALQGTTLVPSVRGFKIADNQSPQPLDRIFYSFNYFEDLNKSINRRVLAPIENVRVYRHFFGLEKTFLDQRASLGLRLPINTLTVDSPFRGLGGTTTSAGDLNFIAKYVLLQDKDKGNLISTGLSVTAPTGPAAFAGTRSIRSFHNTTLQPFVGYLFTRDRFYAQGFFAIDIPTAPSDVTIMYNDFGVGYYVYRASDPDRLISSIAPNFEVHVNTPLNHRGFHPADAAGTPDFVDLTTGLSVSFRNRARFSVAVVEPVTGPRPFDFEILALLNFYY
jgi:hypothetical protein